MKYQLAIDRGNSLTKLSVFDGNAIVKVESLEDSFLASGITAICSSFDVGLSIFSDVRDRYSNDAILNMLPAGCMLVSMELQFPFTIHYSTPETVGHDRLANLSGARSIRPHGNILVVDFGTCITYSLLLDEAFCGGSISPGRQMRLRCLHDYTGSLPLVKTSDTPPTLVGNSTTGSILSGVEYAVLLETDAMIAAYHKKFNDLEVIITGGDYSFFENNLKSAIFAAPQLTQIGLHEILRSNKH